MKSLTLRKAIIVSFIFVLFIGSVPQTARATQGYIVKFKLSGTKQGQKVEYITPKAYKTVTPEQIIIAKIVNNQLKIYQLNPQTKTYQDMSNMAPMLGMIMFEFLECDQMGNCHERRDYFQPMGVRERVGRWNALKFKVKPSAQGIMGGMMQAFKIESYAWLSKEPRSLIKAEEMRIKFFKNLIKALRKTYNSGSAAQSEKMFKVAIRAMKKFIKKYGVRVKSVTTTNMAFMSTTSIEEFISAQNTNIKEDEFKIPPGYRPGFSSMGYRR